MRTPHPFELGTFFRIVFFETCFIVKSRYLGSRMGKLWLLMTPLLMAGIYTFIMSFIFRVRLGEDSSTLDYAVFLLIGMGCFTALSESITMSTASITGNPNLVKNVPLPLRVLPLSNMLASSLTLLVNLVIAAVISLIAGNTLGSAMLILPIWILINYFFLTGICLFLAAANVFMRDIQHSLVPILTLLMFASPVFYTPAMVPEAIRELWLLNPIAILLQGYRDILIYNVFPDAWSFIALTLGGAALYFLGSRAFTKCEPYFAEQV